MSMSGAAVDSEQFRCPVTDGLSSLQLGDHAEALGAGAGREGSREQRLGLKRKFRHVMVSSCAAAAFYVASLNTTLKYALALSGKNSAKVTQRVKSDFWSMHHGGRIRVGIIGCGRLGRQLLSALVAFSSVNPEDVLISMPRLETVVDLHELGMTCVFDNQRVVHHADVVFLCCPPHKLVRLARDVAGCIKPSCIVYSLIAGVSMVRIQSLLKHDRLVVLPQGECNSSNMVSSHLPVSSLSFAAKSKSQTQAASLLAVMGATGNGGEAATDSNDASESAVQLYGGHSQSLLVKSEACLVADSVVDSELELKRNPEHLLSILSSARTRCTVFPLTKLLDKDQTIMSFVTEADGICWAALLIAGIWDFLGLHFSCPHAMCVRIINAVLFNESGVTSTDNWWERNITGLNITDFHVFPTEVDLTDENCYEDEAPNPSGLMNAHYETVSKLLSKDTSLAKAMQSKFTAVLGIPTVLQGKSAVAISQTFAAFINPEHGNKLL